MKKLYTAEKDNIMLDNMFLDFVTDYTVGDFEWLTTCYYEGHLPEHAELLFEMMIALSKD